MQNISTIFLKESHLMKNREPKAHFNLTITIKGTKMKPFCAV